MDEGASLSMTARNLRKICERLIAIGVALSVLLCAAPGAWAQDFFQELFGIGRSAPRRYEAAPPQQRTPRKPKQARQKRDASKQPQQAQTAPQAPSEGPPPPYEPQMMRLSEILGALSFLRDLCGARDGDEWRAKMSALLEAETKSGPRRQKLTGAFNRGFRGYEMTYRTCTPNAQVAISRYLDEGSRIARDITYRYGNP
jgi:uncharacterized protein (TIGR02301 family)